MSENKIFGYDVIKIDQSDSDFPERLKNIPSKPKVLYIVGNIKLLNKKEIVAIVGTRDADKYGDFIDPNKKHKGKKGKKVCGG